MYTEIDFNKALEQVEQTCEDLNVLTWYFYDGMDAVDIDVLANALVGLETLHRARAANLRTIYERGNG